MKMMMHLGWRNKVVFTRGEIKWQKDSQIQTNGTGLGIENYLISIRPFGCFCWIIVI
jgi:hypothetical protein